MLSTARPLDVVLQMRGDIISLYTTLSHNLIIKEKLSELFEHLIFEHLIERTRLACNDNEKCVFVTSE